MKPFEYYLNKKEVRKTTINIGRALWLKKDIINRDKMITKLNSDEFAKIIFENVYDCLREFCDTLLLLDGFKSYSHAASIAYLKNYNFSEAEISDFDRFRYKRNGSKYYGEPISKKDAEEIKKFYKEVKNKIIKIVNEKLKRGEQNDNYRTRING